MDWKTEKNNRHVTHDFGIIAPLIKKNDFPPLESEGSVVSCSYNPLWVPWGGGWAKWKIIVGFPLP